MNIVPENLKYSSVNCFLKESAINYVTQIIRKTEEELCAYEYNTEGLFDLIEFTLAVKIRKHLNSGGSLGSNEKFKICVNLIFLLDLHEMIDKDFVFEFSFDMLNIHLKN